ncbi:MAG: hypothetical protein AAF926_04710 [Pseudomonadota bacterium]
MIIDLIQIYRARRDPAKAAKLAGRFAQSQAIDRLTAPLLIVHLLLWFVVILMGVLTAGLVLMAVKLHGAIALLSLLTLIMAFAAVMISLGLKSGLDRVKDYAGTLGDRGVDHAVSYGNSFRRGNSRTPDGQAALSDYETGHADKR